MSRWVAVHTGMPTGTTTFFATNFATASKTGADPVWADDSDASYATFTGRWGVTVANDYAQARSLVSAPPDLAAVGTFRVAVAWKELGTPYATNDIAVSLSRDPGAFYWARGLSGDGSTDLPVPAGWRVAEMTPLTGITWDTIVSRWQSDGIFAELMTNFDAPRSEPSAITFEEHVVSELRVYVFYQVIVAPPARLFPRSDGLGVGSGRHFPPPKSQQRSGRNFGYY